MSTHRTVITLTALPLLLVGCSKDEPASPAPAPPPPSSSGSGPPDSPSPTQTPAGPSSSTMPSSGGPAVTAVPGGTCRYVDLQKLSTAAGTSLKESTAGETMCFFQSWACKTGFSTQATVVKGKDIYSLDVSDVEGDAAALDVATRAIGAITPA